ANAVDRADGTSVQRLHCRSASVDPQTDSIRRAGPMQAHVQFMHTLDFVGQDMADLRDQIADFEKNLDADSRHVIEYVAQRHGHGVEPTSTEARPRLARVRPVS